MKKLVFTDSGLGGLDVAAGVYEWCLENGVEAEIYFLNALPERGKGYSFMPTMEDKAKEFGRVLGCFSERYEDDLMAIACNTLSVIGRETDYYRENSGKTITIFDPILELFTSDRFAGTDQNYFVFATRITTESGIYVTLLKDSGIAPEKIFPISCGNLASFIELDTNGKSVTDTIDGCFTSLTEEQEINRDEPLVIILGCSHYGFSDRHFASAAGRFGFRNVQIINPNSFMEKSVISKLSASDTPAGSRGLPSITVVTRSEISDEEVASIAAIIEKKSPHTAEALRSFETVHDLF